MESFNKPHLSPDSIESTEGQPLKPDEKIAESINDNAEEKQDEVLTEAEAEGIREYAKKVIQRWHNFKPDYVFLNETSAVPLGYVLKEAYREAYGNEELPIFYRVNPAILPSYHRSGGSGEPWKPYGVSPKLARNPVYLERVKNFFKDRIKKENAKVVVVDEYSPTGISIRAVMDALHDNCGIDYNRIIAENGEGDPTVEHFRGRRKFTEKKIRAKSYANETARLNPKTAKLRGTINRDEIEKSLDYMHELEDVGKQAGQELKKILIKESLKRSSST